MVAPIEPPPPPDDPPPPGPGELPGLAGYMRARYPCNVVISEPVEILDLLHEVIFMSSRMFMSQGWNGKIRLHNKKPVDWALGTAAFPLGDTVLDVDDVSPWIADLKYFLLVDPHTDDSEIRVVSDANYSTDQNSVTLTTSHTGTDFTVVGFSGSDGNSTPATATLTVNSFTATTNYTVELDGVEIEFVPSVSDTEASIASFLAGALKGHPNLNRKFRIELTATDEITFTGKFGTLTVDALTKAHVAPVANPTAAPVLTDAAGTLAAGDYQVAYALRNEHGQTLLSPYETITLAADKKIQVAAITPPAGTTVVWYTIPEPGSTKLRYHSENDGSAFEITSLPLLSAALPPDLNRTGTEVMRVKAVFSDREEVRSGTSRSNVIRASYEWLLGNRRKTINRVDLQYRESTQDWRLVELRLRDDEHIAKIKKVENEEINGQAIDNYFQAYRIAAGLLAEKRDADFFYKWQATRNALLVEEGDVVAITDDGSGVINLPVIVEEISLTTRNSGLPVASFTGMKYSTTLYDDSVVERAIPVIAEATGLRSEIPSDVVLEGLHILHSGDQVTHT